MDLEQRLQPPYDALPLQPGCSVRLLAIHPTILGTLRHSKIKCTMEVHMLDRAPPYIALSYCWGPPDPAEEIVCNGVVMRVWPNLHAALQQLSRSSTCQKRFIWIDALCINQQNLSERSHQVLLMKGIYEGACKVSIWLGPESDSGALKLLKKATEYCRAELKDWKWDLHDTIPYISREDPKSLAKNRRKLPIPSSHNWNAAIRLCDRPYFNRIWVLQEASATTAEILVRDSKPMPWIDFLIAVFWASRKGYLGDHGEKFATGSIFAHIFAIHSRGRNELGIDSWVDFTSHFHATDPRDLVYALYPLIEDAHTLQSTRPPAPDYSMSVGDIFINVTRYVIEASRSLDVLQLLVKPTESPRETFPSWVPQIDRLASRGSGGLAPIPLSKRDLQPQWRTCRDTIVQISPVSNASPTLILKGVLVATITAVFAIEDQKHLGSQLIKLNNQIDVQLGIQNAKDRAVSREVFARTITAGEPRSTIPMEPFNAADLEAYFNACEYYPTAPGWRHYIEESPPAIGNNTGKYLIEYQNRVILLEGGTIGASVNPDTRERDIVCVFFGGKVPYVVRPQGDYFLLVGECYVDHLMRGKAISDWRAGLLKDVWIELR